MTMTCMIIEDESHSVYRIKQLLNKQKDFTNIGVASDGLSAIKMIDEQKPDLIFLDINLPELSGIEILEQIKHNPMVIFVTAYDQYAIKAFEKNAIGYLLKPIVPEKFEFAVNKVIERKHGIDSSILKMLSQINRQKNYLKRFPIKVNSEVLIIPAEEVFYFKAEEKYIFLCCNGKEYFYNSTLKELSDLLDPEEFIRIHNSYIVAIRKIVKLHKLSVVKYRVELSDKKRTRLPVSQGYLKELKGVLYIT